VLKKKKNSNHLPPYQQNANDELATAARRATAACAAPAPAPTAFGSQAPNSKFLNVSLWRAWEEKPH
jgi:hypothetical protein